MSSPVSMGGANRTTMRALLVIGGRLLIVVTALALSTAVGYLLRDLVLRGLLAHTGLEGPLPARGRSESLFMALRASCIVAAAVSMPVILYQGTRCFLPVVQAHQKGSVVLLVALGSLFFLLGEAISVLLLIPFSPQLVWDLVPDYVDTWPLYVAVVSNWTLATGVICASPPVVFFLAKLRILSPRCLLYLGIATGCTAVCADLVSGSDMLLIVIWLVAIWGLDMLLALMGWRLAK